MNIREQKLLEDEKKFLSYAEPELRSSYTEMREYYDRELRPLINADMKAGPAWDILNAAKDFIMESSEMIIMTFELCANKSNILEEEGEPLYGTFNSKTNEICSRHTKLTGLLINAFNTASNEGEKKIMRRAFGFLIMLQELSIAAIRLAVMTIEEILGKKYL